MNIFTSKLAGIQIGYNLFSLLVRLTNAAITFAFGYTYLNTVIVTGISALDGILGGLMITVFFDGAAHYWVVAKKSDGIGAVQIAISKIMATATLVGSTVISAFQLAMSTTLVDLGAFHSTISMAGLIVFTLAATANFISVYFYRANSPEELKDEAEKEAKASILAGKQDQVNKVKALVVAKVNDKLLDKVDPIAEKETAAILREFYSEMGYLHEEEKQESSPTLSSAEPSAPKALTIEELKELIYEAVEQKLAKEEAPSAGAVLTDEEQAEPMKPLVLNGHKWELDQEEDLD